MDETIKRIQSLLADSMETLPLLLSGLLFFIGTLTANTGMLLMIVSIVFGVNTLGFLLNLKPYTQQTSGSIFRIVLSLGLMAALRFTIPYMKKSEGITKDVLLGLTVSVYIVHALYMLFGQLSFTQEEVSGQCSVFGKAGSEFSNPSLWSIAITYIIGFIFANAYYVFAMDVPTVSEDFFKGETNEQVRNKRVAEQQKLVDDRVMNRKIQTGMIMLVCIIVLVSLLWYRINLTNCEQSAFALVFPLLFVALISFYLFYFIVLDCGIRPADVLGITYDMVHPDLINNPVVCVTTPTTKT